jgi:hypothetical protein
MRSYSALAAACIIAQAEAFDWGIVKTGLLQSTLGDDYESHPLYQFHGTRRSHARANMANHAGRKVSLTKEQRHQGIEAHHNLMGRRERLGLAKVGMATPKVEQEFAELNSTSGFILNVLQGMSYSGGNDSKCYNASEDIVIALDTSNDLFKKIYIPAFWAEMQVQFQDSTVLLAVFTVDCSLDKLFNSLSHMATEEGVVELQSRIAGAYLFEISAAQKVWNNKSDYSSQERGRTYGKALAATLNYYI